VNCDTNSRSFKVIFGSLILQCIREQSCLCILICFIIFYVFIFYFIPFFFIWAISVAAGCCVFCVFRLEDMGSAFMTRSLLLAESLLCLCEADDPEEHIMRVTTEQYNTQDALQRVEWRCLLLIGNCLSSSSVVNIHLIF